MYILVSCNKAEIECILITISYSSSLNNNFYVWPLTVDKSKEGYRLTFHLSACLFVQIPYSVS